jgi:hypothetical protein
MALLACRKTDDIHETDEARGQPCVSCHRSAYTATVNPKHVGMFPDTCGTCHNTDDWQPAAFPGHSNFFALDGIHATTACAACHKGTPEVFAGTPSTCFGCHSADYALANTKNANHSAFPTACQGCHKPTGWK